MLIPIRQSRARLAAASKARRLIMHYTAEISEMPGCHFRIIGGPLLCGRR